MKRKLGVIGRIGIRHLNPVDEYKLRQSAARAMLSGNFRRRFNFLSSKSCTFFRLAFRAGQPLSQRATNSL